MVGLIRASLGGYGCLVWADSGPLWLSGMVTRNGPTPSLVYSRWWRPVWQPTLAYNGVRYGPKSAWVRAIGGVLSGIV